MFPEDEFDQNDIESYFEEADVAPPEPEKVRLRLKQVTDGKRSKSRMESWETRDRAYVCLQVLDKGYLLFGMNQAGEPTLSLFTDLEVYCGPQKLES